MYGDILGHKSTNNNGNRNNASDLIKTKKSSS